MPVTTDLRRIALRVSILGAIVAGGLTLYGGRHNSSWLLRLIFLAWAVSPFAAAIAAISKNWRPAARSPFCLLVIALTAATLGIYSRAVSPGSGMKLGFVFLMVPLGSWLLLGLTVTVLRRK